MVAGEACVVGSNSKTIKKRIGGRVSVRVTWLCLLFQADDCALGFKEYAQQRDTAEYGKKQCSTCKQHVPSGVTCCKHCHTFITKDAMVTELGKKAPTTHRMVERQMSNANATEALDIALNKFDARVDHKLEAIKSERVDPDGTLWYRVKWEGCAANAWPQWVQESSIYDPESGETAI